MRRACQSPARKNAPGAKDNTSKQGARQAASGKTSSTLCYGGGRRRGAIRKGPQQTAERHLCSTLSAPRRSSTLSSQASRCHGLSGRLIPAQRPLSQLAVPHPSDLGPPRPFPTHHCPSGLHPAAGTAFFAIQIPVIRCSLRRAWTEADSASRELGASLALCFAALPNSACRGWALSSVMGCRTSSKVWVRPLDVLPLPSHPITAASPPSSRRLCCLMFCILFF